MTHLDAVLAEDTVTQAQIAPCSRRSSLLAQHATSAVVADAESEEKDEG